jgi:formylmethanofuran dehydrogenase subunit A
MSKIIVKNGIIYDPINNVDGEVKDVLIQDGTIVEKFSNQKDVKEIDAKNKTVVPAAIDIHAHIASQQVNWVRLLGTKNPIFQETWKGLTLDFIAKQYLSNGYTFILETNVFPSLSSQAALNLTMLPVLDSAYLLNLSNFWPMELEFQKGMVDQASAYISDVLEKTKAFGLKIYNPFEREEWNFKKLRDDLEKKGRLYNFTPLDVYENMTRYVERLKLPHSIHAHIEAYENEQAKRNLNLVLNRIRDLNLEIPTKPEKGRRSQVFHVAHASSYNMDGDNSELIKFYNENAEFDLDIGFIGFDPINPVISSDRRFITTLSNQQNSFKLIRSAIELEGDTFSSLRIFDKQNKNHCIIWANGLDIALKIKNKWQVQFSVNFPNYSSISKVPQISSWLLSDKAREDFMQNFNDEFLKRNSIASNNDSLSFYEYIIITRASPAKSLGIGDIKGNLGIGADGDLNIIDFNPKKENIQNNYQTVIDALTSMDYVIKSGKIIKKDQSLDLSTKGKIFWAEGIPKKERDTFVLNKKKEFYEKYYSTFYKSTKVNLKEEVLRKIK